MSRTCGWGPPAWRSLTWRTAGTCGRCSSAGLSARRRQPLPSTVRSRARGTARRWDAPAAALLAPCCVVAVACWGHSECRVAAGHAWWAWWARQGPALRSSDQRIPLPHSGRHCLSSAAARAFPPRSNSGCGLQSLAPDVRDMGASPLLLLPSGYPHPHLRPVRRAQCGVWSVQTLKLQHAGQQRALGKCIVVKTRSNCRARSMPRECRKIGRRGHEGGGQKLAW